MYRNTQIETISQEALTSSFLPNPANHKKRKLTQLFHLFWRAGGWGYVAFHDPQNKMAEVKTVARKFSMLYGHAATGIPTPILAAATWSFRGSVEEGLSFVKTLQSR